VVSCPDGILINTEEGSMLMPSSAHVA